MFEKISYKFKCFKVKLLTLVVLVCTDQHVESFGFSSRIEEEYPSVDCHQHVSIVFEEMFFPARATSVNGQFTVHEARNCGFAICSSS